MKIKLTKIEIRALMSCISITEGSLNNGVVMATQKQKRRLNKINLDDLYIKLANYIS
jgi:hypothetical protein